MKTRISFLLFFWCVLLLVPPVLSKKYSDTKSNDTFSFDGTTTSTSSKMSGYGQNYWSVSGSAYISGKAIELGQDLVYKAELWLMATGDLDSSSFPSKDNIDTTKHDGVAETFTKGDASILYLSHPVGSVVPGEVNVYDSQVARELSESLSSPLYSKSSPSSPTGLCASPEFHGDLSGTLMNFAGSKSVLPLSFRSKANKACADSPDAGAEVIAGEKCKRGSLCQKPGTATSPFSHRVECPEERWVWEGIKIGSHKLFSKKQDCEVVWWTCDNKVDVCDKTASHVKPREKSWKQKYVAPDGSVSQYPPTDNTPNCSGCTSDCSSPCDCSGSGTCGGTVTDNTPNCMDCTSHCSSPCRCLNSGTCNGTVATPPPPPEPTLVKCRACNARYDPKSSSAAQHTRQTFPCGVHSGWACSNRHIAAHSTPKTCKRCGTTFYSCNRKGPCVTRRYGRHKNHSAAK